MSFFSNYKKIFGLVFFALVIVTTLVVPTQAVLAETTAAGAGAMVADTGSGFGTAIRWLSYGATGLAAVTLMFGAAPITAIIGTGAVASTLMAVAGGSRLAAIGRLIAAQFAQQTGSIMEGQGVTGATYGVIYAIAGFLKMLLGGFITLFGSIFDWAIQMNFITDYKSMGIVSVGWTLIRDFTNMMFIFFLLYVAIGTILQINGVDAKKTIAQIILAALLVNFSLLITGLFIDGSNVLMREFYVAIVGSGTTVTLVSDKLAYSTQLAAMLDTAKLASLDGTTSSTLNTILIVVVYATFARFLFSVGLIMIGRVIAFMFLLMTSPLAMLGGVIPQLKKYSDKWWDTLMNQAILGPLVMFLLYIIIQMIYSQKTGGKGVFGIVYDTSQNSLDKGFLPYLQFLIVIVMLNLAISIAKEYSGEAGAAVLSVGKQALGIAGGIALGGMALAGQGTIGAYMARIIKEPEKAGAWSKKNLLENDFVRKHVTEPMAKGTFDVRNAVIPATGGIGLGLGLGAAGAGYVAEGATFGTGIQTSNAEVRAKTKTEEDSARLKMQLATLGKIYKDNNAEQKIAEYLAKVDEKVLKDYYKNASGRDRAGLHNNVDGADQGSDAAIEAQKRLKGLYDGLDANERENVTKTRDLLARDAATKQFKIDPGGKFTNSIADLTRMLAKVSRGKSMAGVVLNLYNTDPEKDALGGTHGLKENNPENREKARFILDYKTVTNIGGDETLPPNMRQTVMELVRQYCDDTEKDVLDTNQGWKKFQGINEKAPENLKKPRAAGFRPPA